MICREKLTINAVTRKDGEQGVFRTVQLDRSYKDKEGNWKNSGSLRTSDLPRAVLVLNKAFEYIVTKGSSAESAVSESIEELMGDE